MATIPDSILDKYELIVGLEVHVQLSTQSKIFSSDSAGFGANPNVNIHPVTLGLPGTLPKLNSKVVEYAVKMGLATNCAINKKNHFDRKNYFYADLPKGFQTTQDSQPICVEGFIDVKNKNSETKRIRIHRIHMEDDAGKSMHDQDPFDSLIDLNRAGVPLIEIVSEPDLRSAEEAALYLGEIRKLVRYLDICDGNMEEGSIRCDANISIRLKGETNYGNRCEVKNLNSIRNLQRAIDHEFIRQIQLVEKGEHIEQNTLNFDATTGITTPLRSKETANDYRYFPEPDLTPLILTDAYINGIAAALPELPEKKIKRYITNFGLSEYDSLVLTSEKELAAYFDELTNYSSNYKAAANWIIGPVKSYLNNVSISISDFTISPETLGGLIKLIDSGKINYSIATQKIFPVLLEGTNKSAEEIATQLNVLIDSSDNGLEAIIDEVLSSYPDKVNEFHNGKKGVLGLFMGEVMKKSSGKINPALANKMVLQKLNEKS